MGNTPSSKEDLIRDFRNHPSLETEKKILNYISDKDKEIVKKLFDNYYTENDQEMKNTILDNISKNMNMSFH